MNLTVLPDTEQDTPEMPEDWRGELRRLHNDALRVDWEAHLADLNVRYGLVGRHVLSTTDVGLPPAWFNGDVDAVEPGSWVLVVSLNPGKPPAGFYGNELRRDNGWDFWRRHNEGKWWYARFFKPLAQLAAYALNEELPPGTESGFATERMVFVELCPYASGQFAFPEQTLVELANSDPGFKIAQRVRDLLIEQARPGFVLVNGAPAVRDFELVGGDYLQWETVRYTSGEGLFRGQPKRLRHKQGSYATTAGPIPIAGFPFLMKAGTHNSHAEIATLGRALRDWGVS
jgi:hypothetical protein